MGLVVQIFFAFCLMASGSSVNGAHDVRFRRASASSSSSSAASSSQSLDSGAYAFSGPGVNNFAFPTFQPFFPTPPDFNTLMQQYLATLAAQQNIAFGGFPLGQNAFPFPDQPISNSLNGAQSQDFLATRMGPENGNNQQFSGSSSSIYFGPNGGHGEASVYPSGVNTRIAQDFPPPQNGGGTYGTFVSSSSGTSDVNGKRTSYKSATFGTNDNGKVTLRTVNQ